jgi:capsular polysaccharide export protein
MILYRLTRKLVLNPKQFFIDFINNRKHLKVDPKKTVFAFNIKEWKRPYLEKFYPNKTIVYIPLNLNEPLLKRKYLPHIIDNNIEVLVWGMTLPEIIKDSSAKITYVEDGFIRSIGLGSEHTPPMSLNFDSKTIYFNAQQVSELEDILNNYDFASDLELLARARRLKSTLLNTGISKYNHSFNVDINSIYGEKTKKRVLVLGQVEDDASIKYGCSSPITNNDLVRLAVSENPSSQVIYKPHPDVLLQKRKMLSDPKEVADICEVLVDDIPLAQSLETIDHVYTITSQAGFEALLRNISVTTFGCPFYSGWGVTDDRQPNLRRKVKRTVEEILAAAYILYPKYFDFDKNETVEVEDIIKKLLAEKVACSDLEG